MATATSQFHYLATGMRQVAAILLLGILLFNWAGYRLLFQYWGLQSEQQIETRIDRHQYNESDLLTLRFPLQMPYITDEPDFQRVDGSITLNGIEYQYVRRRIYHDSLFLMCLPNPGKTTLNKACRNYENAINDLQKPDQNHTKQGNAFMKISLAKYAVPCNGWSLAPVRSIQQATVLFNDHCCTANFFHDIEHPPQLRATA